MDYGLEGKVVAVTGGASGIGKAIAQAFHDEGAVVVINGRDREKLEAATRELGPRAHGIVADLTRPADVDRLTAFAETFGPIEFLINNIGIFESMDFFEITDERWLEFFDVNVMTGVRMSRAVLKTMLARNSGSIVFISSDAAIKSIPWMAHYSMTKSAQQGLARALAECTKGTKVRVNAFLPGPTATQSVLNYMAGMAAQSGRTTEQVVAGYFRDNEPSSLIQCLIDPAVHGRAVVALAANPAMNGAAQRCEGGVIRSAF
ncbi:short-subunit dehydrogenase [Roseiarcus fermentans]|uniref:Short-subunit dehydrogenase n=1 Tax=Roseiarcus fermentans TaxID=1473586 RepID=A0A366FWQ2_9HYPH|nr:SDR family oxidoreductase [Roseiarcus fermentans]RBP18129.1 short-subunit dehydrogenase [Roseiarcus fermentans]